MRVSEKLKIDKKGLENHGKSLEDRVGEILAEAVKKCDAVVALAEAEANEILNSYGEKLVIKNNIEWNILDKNKKK